MRFHALLGSFGFACAMASTASAQWHDDFDLYAPGPLAAQSAWEEWSGSSGVDADVDNTNSFTASNSVLIVQDNDVVYDFSLLPGGRPTSGVWTASIKTFVPSGGTGYGWYILMNDYPTNLQWSVQTRFDLVKGLVTDGAAARKVKFDEWVSLVVAIDLDNDRYDSWYGDKTLAINVKWSGTTGQTVIAALDLYGDAGGLSGMYYDDARLEKTSGGPLALTSSPNPVAAGATLKLFSESPILFTTDPGVLFSWTINDTFYIFPLMYVSFDIAGEWKLSTAVPAGLSGIEAGLKMFAVPSGGKVLLSNEDVIIFL
jgi:hypothetical protein